MHLLLATVLLSQDKSAEDAFRKMEEAILEAKTISVRFSWAAKTDAGGADPAMAVRGSLLLKEGNRLLLNESIDKGGETTELCHCSNGEMLQSTRTGTRPSCGDSPPDLVKNARVVLSRLGVQASFTGSIGKGISFKHRGGDLAEGLKLSDFKGEPAEKDGAVLSYTLTSTVTQVPCRVTLVFNPEKLLPLRRKYEVKADNSSIMVEERYEEVTLNSEIQDYKFKPADLPPEPPPRARTPPVTVVPNEPPPDRTEVRPPAPFPEFVWVGGFWKWNGSSFVWIAGGWHRPPRPDAVWVPGHWDKRDEGWVWVGGKWK